MADHLRRLTNIGGFTVLQEKLDQWTKEFDTSSREHNIDNCCEILKLNSKVQIQLYKLLRIISSTKDGNEDDSLVRNRLQPELYRSYAETQTDVGFPDRTTTTLNSSSVIKDDTDHSTATGRNQSLDRDIENVRKEIQELRHQLSNADQELKSVKSLSSVSGYRHTYTNGFRKHTEPLNGTGRVRFSDSRDYLTVDPSLNTSSTSNQFLVQTICQRYNELYMYDRSDALRVLQTYNDNEDENQRTIFAVMQEAMSVVRDAFRLFKSNVRSNLMSSSFSRDKDLEDAVQRYIERNPDMYDLPTLVDEVVRVMDQNIHLRLPNDVSFDVIQPFIRETCKLVWSMCLCHPSLHLAPATSYELFNEARYRRSHDSDFKSSLVTYHAWPCLLQGSKVFAKGEACCKQSRYTTTPRYRSVFRTVPSTGTRERSRSCSPQRRSCRHRYD